MMASRWVRRTWAGCLFAGLTTMVVYGFQWPVDDLAVTATFGENRWDHFHSGIDIGGGEQEIRPIDDGEVIFYFEEGTDSSSLPTGLGNFVVVEHARGVRSLYAHLKPDSIDPDQVVVTKDDSIGMSGDTGSSLGLHLHFEVSDSEFHQLVNPMRLLPKLPDFRAPTIGRAVLVDDPKNAEAGIDLVSGSTIPAGSWNLLLEVYDVSEYVPYFCPMAPYQVQVYLNGQRIVSIVFDGLEERGSHLVFVQTESTSFDQFYVDDWLFDACALSIPEGEVQLEVVASDYFGNESSKLIAVSAVR